MHIVLLVYLVTVFMALTYLINVQLILIKPNNKQGTIQFPTTTTTSHSVIGPFTQWTNRYLEEKCGGYPLSKY